MRESDRQNSGQPCDQYSTIVSWSSKCSERVCNHILSTTVDSSRRCDSIEIQFDWSPVWCEHVLTHSIENANALKSSWRTKYSSSVIGVDIFAWLSNEFHMNIFLDCTKIVFMSIICFHFRNSSLTLFMLHDELFIFIFQVFVLYKPYLCNKVYTLQNTPYFVWFFFGQI